MSVLAWELAGFVCTTPVVWLGLLTVAANATALSLYFTPAGRAEGGGMSFVVFACWMLGTALLLAMSIASGLECWRARRGGSRDSP